MPTNCSIINRALIFNQYRLAYTFLNPAAHTYFHYFYNFIKIEFLFNIFLNFNIKSLYIINHLKPYIESKTIVK